jgi:hypothetical protein
MDPKHMFPLTYVVDAAETTPSERTTKISLEPEFKIFMPKVPESDPPDFTWNFMDETASPPTAMLPFASTLIAPLPTPAPEDGPVMARAPIGARTEVKTMHVAAKIFRWLEFQFHSIMRTLFLVFPVFFMFNILCLIPQPAAGSWVP